tara:strand:+ start:1388 stop:1657 length:270 start_codon:yes stop_codon:yes gene_type:complete
MFLKLMLSFSLIFILMLTLLAYLQLDFQIKKTNSDIYNLSQSFNQELDEHLSLNSRILLKKSLKDVYESSSQSLSMIRPNEILNIEVAK